MLTSPRFQVPYPNPDRSDSADVPRDIGAVVTGLEKAAIYGQGTLAARPVSSPGTPGIQGRIYYTTDEGLLYYDYGTGWNTVTPAILPGFEMMYAGTAAPAGWAFENGQPMNKTVYGALFAVIGTLYGDAGADFLLPDAQGLAPVHRKAGDANFGSLGQKGGEKLHRLTSAETPRHRHIVDNHQHYVAAHGTGGRSPAHSHNATMGRIGAGEGLTPTSLTGNQYVGSVLVTQNARNISYATDGENVDHSHSVGGQWTDNNYPQQPGTDYYGVDTPDHNNLQPYIVKNIIIKL
jgi:microcystin-dependent protein